ncbi:MAG: AIR synthase related protein [Lachnospiraceae bacterium]|nr:AIR synthase related protein [Lachnospiraceae bacterium]
MKSGKVSDTVLRRSILNEVQKVNQGSLSPQVGGGAVSFPNRHVAGGIARAGKDEVVPEAFGAMQTVSGEGLATAYLAAVRAANSLAAKGATPQYAAVAITVPESMDERDLRKMHERYCEYLRQHNIKIAGGHTAVSAVVTEPVVSVQMTGAKMLQNVQNSEAKRTGEGDILKAETQMKHQGSKNTCRIVEDYIGFDIVMTKHCGLGGTALLAGHFTEELTARYPKRFIEHAADLFVEAEKNAEAFLAVSDGAVYVHAAAEGGVFGALWELAEYAQCGLEIELPAIPILQETVEICEYFDVNPYQLRTEGVFLILTQHGGRLCESLAEQGISAAVIGKTVPGLDRAVRNCEEVRYLEPNRVEEYERVMAQRRAEAAE